MRRRPPGRAFGVVWGMETPQYFAPRRPDFIEEPSLRRSNAHSFVAAEVAATRTAARDCSTPASTAATRYPGPEPPTWLERLLANRLPAIGKLRLAPMLSPSGKLMGDLTVTRLAPDRFWLVGSYHLQEVASALVPTTTCPAPA